MFGDRFWLDYHQQRHAELVQRADQARLVICLEASCRGQLCKQRRAALHKRMLAATGDQLVRLGGQLQRAGLTAS